MDSPRYIEKNTIFSVVFECLVYRQLCVRFMRESIAVDTVCEFTQVSS